MIRKRHFWMKAMMMKRFCEEGKGGHFNHPFGSFKEKMEDKIIKELDLNEEQQAKLQAIHNTMQSMHDKKKDTHTDVYKNILSQIRSEKLDKSFVDDLIYYKYQNVQEFKPLIFEKISDFHASLNPEQKEKLASHVEKLHTMRHCCHH